MPDVLGGILFCCGLRVRADQRGPDAAAESWACCRLSFTWATAGPQPWPIPGAPDSRLLKRSQSISRPSAVGGVQQGPETLPWGSLPPKGEHGTPALRPFFN